MKSAFARMCVAMSLIATGCASDGAPPRGASLPPNWRDIATAEDRDRLSRWRPAWTRALEQAQNSGHGAEIAAEGPLLAPDAAVEWEDPPPGLYSCRTIKLGAKSQGLLDYVAYPAFDCRLRLDDGVTKLAKLGGSQRPIGLILPYSSNRKVFLGTLQLGDETRPLEYGRDRERDLAALVERIGPTRWRLVFPYPHFESTIDVVELVPKG